MLVQISSNVPSITTTCNTCIYLLHHRFPQLNFKPYCRYCVAHLLLELYTRNWKPQTAAKEYIGSHISIQRRNQQLSANTSTIPTGKYDGFPLNTNHNSVKQTKSLDFQSVGFRPVLVIGQLVLAWRRVECSSIFFFYIMTRRQLISMNLPSRHHRALRLAAEHIFYLLSEYHIRLIFFLVGNKNKGKQTFYFLPGNLF